LKGDCNLRNFIWNGKKICGLDFEESTIGDPCQDLGEICFFLLTNSPPLTPLKMEMVDWFLKSYQEYSETKIRNISDFIAKSARKAYKRRANFNRI
jgi:aminoglycoside phosphotransferase (APT) family kinase protein